MRLIDKIIVHCSDSPDNAKFTAKDVKQWHTTPSKTDPSKPWSDIGYHFVVERDGSLSNGRRVETVGSHVAGHNATSIGICMMGRDHFTPEQYASLERLLKILVHTFNARVYGHRDFNKGKTCPNDEIYGWLKTHFMKG